MLFNMIDMNRDKKICETDIFNLIRLVEDKWNQQMITPDILLILDKFKIMRENQGKQNWAKLKIDKVHQNVEMAEKNKMKIEKLDHKDEVFQFVGIVNDYKQRVKDSLEFDFGPQVAKEAFNSENSEIV